MSGCLPILFPAHRDTGDSHPLVVGVHGDREYGAWGFRFCCFVSDLLLVAVFSFSFQVLKLERSDETFRQSFCSSANFPGASQRLSKQEKNLREACFKM